MSRTSCGAVALWAPPGGRGVVHCGCRWVSGCQGPALRCGPCGTALRAALDNPGGFTQGGSPAASVDGSAELVLVQDGEVLDDDAWGQPGEQGELLAGMFGVEQADPFEAFDVTVVGLLGVVGAAGDLRGGQPFQVEADDR